MPAGSGSRDDHEGCPSDLTAPEQHRPSAEPRIKPMHNTTNQLEARHPTWTPRAPSHHSAGVEWGSSLSSLPADCGSGTRSENLVRNKLSPDRVYQAIAPQWPPTSSLSG